MTQASKGKRTDKPPARTDGVRSEKEVAPERGSLSGAKTVPSDRRAAEIAVQQVGDWAKWMAGIQTAAIGGLAAVLLDKNSCPVPLDNAERFTAVFAFLFLSIALLVSAWVLSAVASISLRLASVNAEPPSAEFDFYAWSSFTWFGGRSVRFGFLMGIQHWSWALGLASLATFGLLHFG